MTTAREQLELAALALPPISNEDRRWLSDNPNTSDIVEWIRDYANLAIREARLAVAVEIGRSK